MSSTSARQRGLLAHLLLIAVTLVWGSTFPLVKATLRDVTPLLFNFMRMTLASAALLAVNWRSVRALEAAHWRVCALAGALLALGYELQTVGLTRTTPSKSAFLTGLVVVLVPLLNSIPGIRAPGTGRPRPISFLGALLAFGGIVLLTTEPGAGLALLSGLHLGEWLTLGCALAFAGHLLTLARAATVLPPRALATLQIVFATFVMLFCLPLERHPAVHWTRIVVLTLAVTSILATAAAFTIQSWAQQYLPASHTALIFTMEPVFAWLTSLLFIHERLGPRSLAGAGLILAGILVAELGPTTWMQPGILPAEL